MSLSTPPASPGLPALPVVDHGRDLDTGVQAAYARQRPQLPSARTLVALCFGQETMALAWGTGAQAAQVALLPCGVRPLEQRYLATQAVNALSVEQAIAEVEDAVMPWHRHWPADAVLATDDALVLEWARWAGRPAEAGVWYLDSEAVEALFNRWVARVQGRPASQDPLPVGGPMAVALLVLREWLHHVGFDGITVMRHPDPACPAASASASSAA